MEETGSSFSLSSLLCKESESFLDEEQIEEGLFINFNNYPFSETEDDYIKTLIERENSFEIKTHGRSFNDCSTMIEDWLKCARFDAFRWILKTTAFFGFGFQTAYLSVTYFDRFLSKRNIDNGKDWAIRLLSVACLSLAAKMEECSVPILSEFGKIKEYYFENKVIQRMELLILNTLEWRMGSITPFSYLHFFITKFSHESQPKDLVSKSVELILAMIEEMNLINDHPPSVIAAAAVLAVSNKRLTRKMVELKMNLVSSCVSLKNDQVFSCYNLMQKLEMEKFKMSTNVLEDSSLTSASETKRRRLTFDDYDQNYDLNKEKEFH